MVPPVRATEGTRPSDWTSRSVASERGRHLGAEPVGRPEAADLRGADAHGFFARERLAAFRTFFWAVFLGAALLPVRAIRFTVPA